MKRKLISVMALLLMMAMLFTSCAVNYAKADLSKYLTLAESGYSGLKLSVEKQVYTEEAVLKRVFETLRTAVKYEGDVGTNVDEAHTSGIIQKYDEVSFYTYALDKDGNVAMSNIKRDEKGNISAETIGVGYGTNKDMLLELEKEFYGGGKDVDIADHLFLYTNEKAQNVPAEAFWFITFSTATKGEDGKAGTIGKGQSSEYVLNSSLYLDKEQGSGDRYEAVALGIKAFADYFDGTEDKTDGVRTGGSVFTINIYPTDTADDKITTKNESTAVNLKYDLDIDGDDTFDIGTIVVTLKAAAYLKQGEKGTASEGFKATPILMEYTFPDDYEGKYTVDGSEKKLAGVTVDVYIYPTYKTSYEMPEYEPETDEEKTALMEAIKAKMPSDLTDVDALKEAYEKHVRTELEKSFVETAEAEAREKIWEAVVANTSLIEDKLPQANLRALVRNEKRRLRYNYTTNSSETIVDPETGKKTYVTAKESGKYQSYLEYAAKVEYELVDENADKKTSERAIEGVLWNQAKDAVKKMMLTYYLGDKLGVSVSEEEYQAKLNAEASEWISQMQSFYSYFGSAVTFTVDDYIEACGGEDNIRSACLLEKVKDKLYENNKSGITYTTKDVAAIVESDDEEHDHEH